MSSSQGGPASNGTNSPIPEDDLVSHQSNTPRGNAPGSNSQNITSGIQGTEPLAGLSERVQEKLPAHYIFPPVVPRPTNPIQFDPSTTAVPRNRQDTPVPELASLPAAKSDIGYLTQTMEWNAGNQSTSTMMDHSTRPSPPASSPRTTPSQQPRRHTTVWELSGMIDEIRLSLQSDFFTITSKFAIEVAKIQTAHEHRFETVASYILGVEETLGTNGEINLPPLDTQVSTAPTVAQKTGQMLGYPIKNGPYLHHGA
ncbi:hypothetical protein AAF712_010269 [Marasmius tenuissimus]|uniref:Uncharacterized protein n=1 Tax=Marasmius tenuissimus TaxID=585030 RepID=A0ABR2ZR00_9AGAR